MVEKTKGRIGHLIGLFLITCFLIPVSSTGEEPTPVPSETKSPEPLALKQNASSVTFSDVANWFQRTGNRVGEEISKAASKTASAVKKAVSEDAQENGSEDGP